MDSIIFDVDGTLWDSTEIVARSWNEYLHTHTAFTETLTPARLKSLFGKLLPEIAANLFPDFDREEQLRLIHNCCQAEHEALLKECAPLYPKLEETLAYCAARVPLFIVSNCQAGYIEVFLAATGFSRYFKGHLCPGDTGNPKAENIMQICREHHLKAPLYVGDTQGDFEACQKASVPFVFASYGFGNTEKPDYEIKTPLELCTLLDSLQ